MDAGTGMFGLVVLLGPGTSNDGSRLRSPTPCCDPACWEGLIQSMGSYQTRKRSYRHRIIRPSMISSNNHHFTCGIDSTSPHQPSIEEGWKSTPRTTIPTVNKEYCHRPTISLSFPSRQGLNTTLTLLLTPNKENGIAMSYLYPVIAVVALKALSIRTSLPPGLAKILKQ